MVVEVLHDSWPRALDGRGFRERQGHRLEALLRATEAALDDDDRRRRALADGVRRRLARIPSAPLVWMSEVVEVWLPEAEPAAEPAAVSETTVAPCATSGRPERSYIR